MCTDAEMHRAGKCPFCTMPPSEHEQRDGYLHRVYICDNAPHGWRGTFVDQPISQPVEP